MYNNKKASPEAGQKLNHDHFRYPLLVGNLQGTITRTPAVSSGG